MSDVEKFFYAIQKHFGDNRQWSELSPEAQHVFIAGINNILAVMHKQV